MKLRLLHPRLAVLLVALVPAAIPAFAGTVGGSVAAINTLTTNFVSSLTIVGASAATDLQIVSGQIDNNNDAGWKLTITSANSGVLKRTTGTGDNADSRVTYTNVKLVKTGGTLGAGLTDPANGSTGVAKDITSGSVIFNTGSAVGTPGTATTATVGYLYALKISYDSTTTLLSGTYSDTITLTLANDS